MGLILNLLFARASAPHPLPAMAARGLRAHCIPFQDRNLMKVTERDSKGCPQVEGSGGRGVCAPFPPSSPCSGQSPTFADSPSSPIQQVFLSCLQCRCCSGHQDEAVTKTRRPSCVWPLTPAQPTPATTCPHSRLPQMLILPNFQGIFSLEPIVWP